MTWGGQFENQQRANARLKIIIPISVFLIFVLLLLGVRLDEAGAARSA